MWKVVDKFGYIGTSLTDVRHCFRGIAKGSVGAVYFYSCQLPSMNIGRLFSLLQDLSSFTVRDRAKLRVMMGLPLSTLATSRRYVGG